MYTMYTYAKFSFVKIPGSGISYIRLDLTLYGIHFQETLPCFDWPPVCPLYNLV